ncbi:MAG: DUF2785 domain-containing protein, partial [Arenimonas sp.]
EACPPTGWPAPKLQALKEKGYEIEAAPARQRLALQLLGCLSSPAPALRDGIAFEAWSRWLRADALDLQTRQAGLATLQPRIAPGTVDAAGFGQPFAALVRSELARSDRKQPWLEPAQRAALLESAARYLESVHDYRGFIGGEGWRHGVAHGADLLMQLALNPALDKAQLDRILAAVASQLAPPGQSYVFGEPGRLARPVLFAAARGLHSQAEWQDWFSKIAAPPTGGWQGAFGSTAGLARRHDVHAFLLEIYLQARDSEEAGIKAMLPALRTQLEAVP